MIIDVKDIIGNKYEDAMETICYLDEISYKNLCDHLKGSCYQEIEFSNGKELKFCDYLKFFNNKLSEMDENTEEYKRIQEIVNSRDLNSFGIVLREKYDLVFSNVVFNNVIKILENDEYRKKFINFEKNKEEFQVKWGNGKIQPASKTQQSYIKILTSMFGRIDSNDKIENDLSDNFYIPNIDKYKKSYIELYKQLDLKKYIPKLYRYKREYLDNFESIIQLEDEPTWKLNSKIEEMLFKDMPKDLSSEEKILYIYSKMCKSFLYDEGYVYRDRIERINYTPEFSKEHLENIKPGDKVTCYDFSRIATKAIKQMNEEIDAVIISSGTNKGHFSIGFSTPKCVGRLEAINVMESRESTDIANDLLRAKMGTKLQGINMIVQEKNIIENAMDKVYLMVTGSPIKDETDILMEQIKTIPKDEGKIDLKLKLSNLVNNMKKSGISGNEFTLVFNNILHSGFLGNRNNIISSYLLTKKINNKGEEYFNRIICVGDIDENNQDMHLIDVNSLEITSKTLEEIERKINKGEFLYESSNRTIYKEEKEI